MNTEFPKKVADNVTMYAADPMVYVVHNFVSDLECKEFIDLSANHLEVATVNTAEGQVSHKNRTNRFAWLQHNASDLLHEVSKRFSILVQMPIRNAEQFQVVHYGPGAEYKPHFDSFDENSESGKQAWEPGGQRMITALLYLNDVEAGGATHFPELGVSIDPKKGDVLVFHNCLPESTIIHPRSLHAGMPVESGEKWAANLWFRENLRY